MSRRRHLEPFRKYSDWPSRDTRRFTEISLNLANSPGAEPSLLSKMSSMEACPTGLRALEPLKITSVMDSPRRYLAELSPITQRTASIMLDLPQPLGPTTAVILDGNGTVVGSTNDLKPASLMDFRRIVFRNQSSPTAWSQSAKCTTGLCTAQRESLSLLH